MQRCTVVLHCEAVLLRNCIRILESFYSRSESSVFSCRSFDVRVELVENRPSVPLFRNELSLRVVDVAVPICEEEVSVRSRRRRYVLNWCSLTRLRLTLSRLLRRTGGLSRSLRGRLGALRTLTLP